MNDQQPLQPNIQPEIPQQGAKLPLWAIILIAVLSVVVIGLGSYAAYRYFADEPTPESTPEPTACAEDAKVCPDGSSVGRILPDCEFAACPEVVDPTADWQTYENEEYGFEVGYPGDLSPEVKVNIPSDNIFLMDFGDGKIFKMSIYDTGMEGQIRLYTIENTEKKISVNGIEGFQFKTEDMKGNVSYIPQTIIKKENRLYLFVGEGNIFNQILSTFKFIK